AGVRLFELDQPDVLRLKAAVLTDAGAVPRSDRRAVAVDLRADWSARLVDAGFDREVPTAWLAEGLLVYLEPSDVEQLLTAMTELSAPGSRFAAERGDLARTMADAARAAATMSGTAAAAPDDVTRLWHDGPAAGLAGWLAAHGWQTTEHELGDLGTAYGRPPSAPTRSGFVTATR
ncbi:MAG TPA: SAM-dependent methyltransferase, partial [Mycobacteriales bacterium]|nr:SAM-dependent methyltransferase [Mycobacteriales bacterium]